MELYSSKNEERHLKLYTDIINREKLEKIAAGALCSEKLKKLNLSIDNLPQKCQNVLQQTAEMQLSLGLQQLDSPSICLYQTRNISTELQDNYEILKLKQKNVGLDVKIDRNNKFLEELKKELVNSKKSLANQNPNPSSIQDLIRQLKQKLISYKESYEKIKRQYSDLSVPESILPKSLNSQVALLMKLKEEADSLKQQAEDASLVKEVKEMLKLVRK